MPEVNLPAIMLRAIIAALPPLSFAPASEAPAGGWCLVAPADGEWCIARRDEGGWFSANEERIEAPLVYAALPPAPGRNGPRQIRSLAAWVVDAIDDGDYATAATAIDELADAIREARKRR